jgi:serpin B
MILPFLMAAAMIAPNDFAFDAYHQVAKGDGNLILSPFSISTALSMLLVGARGRTATEIAATLHQHGDHAAVAALPAELSIANGLWVQRGLTIEAAFEKTLQTRYQAPPTSLDFAADPEQARAAINAWTAQHTKDKIQDLFGPGSIKPDTRLVLTSAIYFYGKWQSAFKPADTHAEAFQLAAGGTVQTNFMHQKAEFQYAETAAAQILEMKYAGTPIAFDILLPKTNDGLPALERAIDSKLLTAWLGTLAPQTVEVTVPKFRAESSFSLRDALSRLGMADAFSRKADFSGIDGRHDLYVSEVVHKAFVDVSEEGTEAAAATGIGIRALAMRPHRDIVFRADHPFLFFIRDTASGAILFEGRLTQPKS